MVYLGAVRPLVHSGGYCLQDGKLLREVMFTHNLGPRAERYRQNVLGKSESPRTKTRYSETKEEILLTKGALRH